MDTAESLRLAILGDDNLSKNAYLSGLFESDFFFVLGVVSDGRLNV
jgi:hypothetical protein